MSEQGRFLFLWVVVLAAGGIAIAAMGRYGSHVAAFGFLYAALATSWSWLRSTGSSPLDRRPSSERGR